MKKNFALLAMAVLALGLTACKDESKTETTEKAVVNGTEVERTTSTETEADGNESSTETKTETTVDPEGMMNKETVEDTKKTTEESH